MDKIYNFKIQIELRLHTKKDEMFVEQKAELEMQGPSKAVIEDNAFPIISNTLLQQGLIIRKLDIVDIVQGEEITADMEKYQKFLDNKENRLEFAIKGDDEQ